MYSYQYGSFMQNQNAYEQNLKNIINQANAQLQQLQNQSAPVAPQPTNLTQNFQLAPNNSNTNELESKYVENIDEVKNTFVAKTGIFITKTLDTLWIKNTNGDIRTFELSEIIQTDPKDTEILMLKKQIEEMKEMIANESNVNNSDNDESNESKNATKLSNNKRTNAKQK